MSLQHWLSLHWWQSQPSRWAKALRIFSPVYGAGFALHQSARSAQRQLAPVPCVVVGNWVVGGVGKTPLLIALVQALIASGHRPGVISRGHGRAAHDNRAVLPHCTAQEVGDEPLLIARRTGVPVWVGRQRLEVAKALCQAHGDVDVLVSDDGLQHHALQPDAALVVFDDRGAGNGLLLPAGPLREPLPNAVPEGHFVVYTGNRVSTGLPGLTVARKQWPAIPLQSWDSGHLQGSRELAQFRGHPVVALAGLGEPEGFFRSLELHGLKVHRCAQPDHAIYRPPWPWPADTQDVITTEKDAVKLLPLLTQPNSPRIWVVPLDCEIPQTLLQALLAAMPRLQPKK